MKKHQTEHLKLATRAVHTGEREGARDFLTTSTPIYQTASYVTDTMEQMEEIFAGNRPGFVYTRYGNPTVQAFEEVAASLEGAQGACAFGSGMAAIHTALLAADVGAGDDIVASRDIYGATHALMTNLFPALSIRVTLVDITDLAAVEQALVQRQPKVLYFETISNPLMKVADLPALVELGHKYHATVIVDSTFTPPVLLRPLEYGADVVLHSATKYMSGHGDTSGGVVTGSAEYINRAHELIKLTGGLLAPHDAWLILRGVKTLPLRVREQCRNAARIANTLAQHPRITRVYYPGLSEHPQHDMANKLLGGEAYGAMLAFEIAGADQAGVFRFFEALKVCVRATTLGDIYTLLLYPVQSSHRMLTQAQRENVGIGDGLVRLSAGIEDVDDIITDLCQALDQI